MLTLDPIDDLRQATLDLSERQRLRHDHDSSHIWLSAQRPGHLPCVPASMPRPASTDGGRSCAPCSCRSAAPKAWTGEAYLKSRVRSPTVPISTTGVRRLSPSGSRPQKPAPRRVAGSPSSPPRSGVACGVAVDLDHGSRGASGLSGPMRRRAHVPASGNALPDLAEREVLILLAQGLPNSANAARLHRSSKTVREYASLLFAKLQVTDRGQRSRRLGMPASEDHVPTQ